MLMNRNTNIIQKIVYSFICFVFLACSSSIQPAKWENPTFVRSENNPMISPDMEGLEGKLGENINGPSVIKVPNWVENPLAKYYMYFATSSW